MFEDFLLKFLRFCFILKTLLVTLMYRNYYLSKEGIEEYSEKYISRSPLFIKIAQWFSTREDMVSGPIRIQLQKFQSFAPIDSTEYVMQTIKEDQSIVFQDITELSETPIASGSIAQVHRCKYKGKDCALKVIHEEAYLLLIDLGIVITFDL